MPELSTLHIALLAGFTAAGAIAGWVLRGRRSEQEKTAVNAASIETTASGAAT